MCSEIIAISERSYDSAPARDVHDFWQLVLPIAGSLVMRIAGRPGVVDGRHYAALPPGTEHVYHAEGGNRFLVVDLALAAVPASSPALRTMDARMSSIVGVLLAESALGGLGDAPIRSALGQYVAAALGADQEPFGRPAASPVSASVIAARARDLVASDPARAWTIDELAHAACTSPRHLARCFRATYGVAPSSFARSVRLNEAKRLLASAACNAGEAAAHTAFPSQSHFTRAFSAEFGMTPGAWSRLVSSDAGKKMSRTGKPRTDRDDEMGTQPERQHEDRTQ